MVGGEYIESVTDVKPDGSTSPYDGSSQVGVNVVEVGGNLYEESGAALGIADLTKPIDIAGTGFGQYSCLGGFCSQYTNNPIFQVFNMQPGGASFAFWHDTAMLGVQGSWVQASILVYYPAHQFVISGGVGAGIISSGIKPKSTRGDISLESTLIKY